MTVEIRRHLTRDVLTEYLDVPTGSPYVFHPGVRLSFWLDPGDVVQLVAHLEGTNDLGYNCMFARYMKEHEDVQDFLHDDPGTLIATPMGLNISQDIHHGMLEVSGSFIASESRVHNFTVGVYAASTAADPGDKLQLQYGEMSAVTWHTVDEPWVVFDETEFQ